MSAASGVGNMAALLAGTISFLSPCVLPLVPAYLSYIAGEFESHSRQIKDECDGLRGVENGQSKQCRLGSRFDQRQTDEH